MIRTIMVLAALVIAVLFMPVWIQLILFLVAVWAVPFRVALIAPALFSDVLYNPGHWSIDTFKMTLAVAAFILIRWLLLTQTRFASLYSPRDTYDLEA